MTVPLPSDDVAAADMVLLRIAPPAAPGPATDLLRRYVPELLRSGVPELLTGEGSPDELVAIAGGHHYLLVDVAAEDPHRALAAALVLPSARSTPPIARLVAIAVEPALRSRGLATRLLADVRRSLHARGELLELRTNADESLTKMLRELGFAEDPEPFGESYAHPPVGRPVRWLSRDS